MHEQVHEGLMKEDSLSARIYFLLLNKPLTQTELSKKIYSGKVQLANIKKNIEDLEKEGFVERLPREIGAGKNYNQLYYISTLKPFENFVVEAVKWRKDTSKSNKKEELTEKDRKFLRSFLSSEWFKRFYSQEYLAVDLECEGKKDNRFCSCPIRFLARLLEEIFVITQMFGNFKFLFNYEELSMESFDSFIKSNQNRISEQSQKTIKRVVKLAKEGLGNYPGTNKTIDFYFEDYGVLYLPYSLAKKLSSIGRVPLTVAVHFNAALKEELLR